MICTHRNIYCHQFYDHKSPIARLTKMFITIVIKKKGRTALDFASFQNHQEIVELLGGETNDNHVCAFCTMCINRYISKQTLGL